MSSSNQLKIGIILNYVNLMIGGLIPFLYTPIMLKILGQEEYGLYKLSDSVTSYLSLMSLGLGAAITRYIIKAREEKGLYEEQRILGLFIVIFRAISVLTIIVGMLLAMNIGQWYDKALTADELDKMRVLIFLLSLNTAINFFATPYVSVVNSHERFVFLQGMNIFSTCAGPIFNLIALFLGYASIGMAISSLFAAILYRIIYYYYVSCQMKIKPLFSKVENSLLKEILVFSFWIFVSNIVGQLYSATSTLLIGAIPSLATIGVAIFNVGMVFSGMIFVVNGGISSLLLPKANKMVFSGATDDEITDTAIRLGRIQCYIISLLIFGFVAFGRPFIHFYVGDEYQKAYWIAVLCMIPNIIPLIQSFCLNILIARNRNKFRAISYLVVAVFNVIGTWILLHVIGIIGAALMTCISLVLGQGIIMNWYYHNKLGINIFRFWKEVIRIIIMPSFLCLLFVLLGNYWNYYDIMNMVIGILFFTICYMAITWFINMNDYEKNIVLQPFRKLRH